jgi:hypothetical protein
MWGNESAETEVGLTVPSGDTPVFLELSKEVLDQMPPCVGPPYSSKAEGIGCVCLKVL